VDTSDPLAESDGLPLQILKRIDEACLRFEAGWLAGGRPRLSEFLGGAEGAERSALLAELLKLELDYRRRCGETPRPDEYAAVFRQDEGALRAAFRGAAPTEDAPTAPNGALTRRPPPAWPAIPGYEILGVLGSGAMGVVYRARHAALGRVVALKMIRGDHAPAPADVRRFTAEARAMAALDHPHVVPVYEVGECQGRPYFTAKLLGGGSLAQHLGRLGADPRRAVALLEKVARAVEYLHERGILHRDLKPANVLLDQRDEPHVSDFGLAKIREGGVDLTVHGAVLGTLPYMAPEQAAGQTHRLGPAAEVWSLGVVLYELLAGRRPFEAAGREELTRRILDGDFPPPRAARPALDPPLERVILCALRTDPADRYPSAAVLADDLGRWLRGEIPLGRPDPAHASGQPPAGWSPRAGSAGALCVLAAVLCAGSLLGEGGGPAGAPGRTAAPARILTLIGDAGPPARAPRWVVGAAVREEGLSPKDGTYAVRSPGLALLELTASTRWPRFRVEAEIRHDASERGEAGLYFARTGRAAQAADHVFCKVAFADALRRRGGALTWEVNRYRAARHESLGGAQLATLQFKPAGTREARRWRRVAVEVTPQEASVSWDGIPVARIPIVRLEKNAADLVKGQGAGETPLNLSGGIGLYVSEGAASFRKVTIRRMP
jgi:hypothetical protein